MGFIDNIAARFGYVKPRKKAMRYAAAEISRLTASLRTESDYINNTLRYELATLRARSRQASQNNPYARRFAQMCVDNIAGPTPFKLEAKVKNRSGKQEKLTNSAIEDAWCKWGRAGNCDITQKWAWSTLVRLYIRTLAVEGELLFRIHKGPQYGPFGVMVQQIDCDRLWEQNNTALTGGGAIHMGVEVDGNAKPVAYHILKRKPNQWQSGRSIDSERVPAEEIIHVFVPEFAEQVRGVPWMYAALINLVNMGAFEEAAVIAARVGASQMGFLQTEDGGAGMAAQSEETAAGVPQIDAEPGTFPMLPAGVTMASWTPNYPDAAVGPFIKAMLRGVAAGVGVAYHNLANDLEGVNYSSARIGELDERDSWMVLQNFFIEHVLEPFAANHWLPMAAMTGQLGKIDAGNLDKYRAFYWQGRRWSWVDPLKEVKAAIEAIDNNLTSRTRVVAEGGSDFEDVVEELAAEQAMLAEAELPQRPAAPGAASAAPAAEPAEPADSTDAPETPDPADPEE